MTKTLREILKELYDSGYGVTGHSDEGSKYRVDQSLTSLTSALVKRVEGLVSEYDDWDSVEYEQGYKRCLTDIVDMLKEASCER